MKYNHFTKRLFPYLKPHIWKLVFTSILTALSTGLESAIPEITGQIVDVLFSENRTADKTIFFSLLVFGVISLSALFSLISMATSSWVANKVIMDLRVDMFKKLLKLPKSYFDKSAAGKILSKLTFDVEQIAGAASSIWLEFIKAFVAVIVLTIYLFYKNWQLSLTLLVIMPIVFIAVKHTSERMRVSSTNVQNSIGNMTHLLDENISGNSIIKIFQAEKYEKEKFNNLIHNVRQQRFKVDMSAAMNSNLINILLGSCLALVVYFSAFTLEMSAGEFLSFFTALAMLIKPSKTLVNIMKPFQISIAAGENVFNFLDEDNESDDGRNKIKEMSGNISFKNINFSYDKNKTILEDFSLEIKQGETIAIVGPTGSGKTTLIDLLSKFYLPNKGVILIDGININDIPNKSLRKNIAFVDQGTRLFNDSIRSNIAFGEQSNLSLNKIKDAAEKAGALEFIDTLEDKFDTNIGDNGNLLSGGQKQRLAIARAIAKDAPILLLDEATSALDSATEKVVQEAIFEMSKNKTTIIIAHRLSTIQNADRIIVMKAGKLLEEGTHKSLIKNSGYYSQLVKDQFK